VAPEEVKKPLPTPEETVAEVERLKEEYRAGQESPILTEMLAPEDLQVIREGQVATPVIDNKIKAALIGERSRPDVARDIGEQEQLGEEGVTPMYSGPDTKKWFDDDLVKVSPSVNVCLY
jgi:hypothetical protein